VKERTEELIRANDDLKAEILERKRFETAIQLANRKLNTLSSITRHDILNQITAIGLYLSLAEELATGDEVISNLHKIGKITDLIRIQIQFTRDYQDIGASAPEWQDVSTVITTAIAELDHTGLRVEKELEGLEVYADLLFHKVFSNIVENTICHGERATYIRFYLRETNVGIAICCEDDGIGIPQNAKERIFKREYYRNTGYGLFLADEILSITGISIRETGVEGMGARFEILVPRGAYQIQKKS
jgi:signal transduction histidine kinase